MSSVFVVTEGVICPMVVERGKTTSGGAKMGAQRVREGKGREGHSREREGEGRRKGIAEETVWPEN